MPLGLIFYIYRISYIVSKSVQIHFGTTRQTRYIETQQTSRMYSIHVCMHNYVYLYIHSPAALLGTTVQLLGNTNC